MVYAYLAEGVGRSKAAEGAFKALSRGFTHWASGRLEHLEINIKNPSYSHVRSNMKPSIKQGSYDVYLLLERIKEDMASIQAATCQCTAGYVCYMYLSYTFKILLISLITCRKSASCAHISALLHALVALTPVPFPVASSVHDDDAESVPVTSLPCQWRAPRKRKESNLKMSDATFEKHVYGQRKKVKLLPIEDYDPRPEKYRNKVDTHMKKFLAAVRGKGLGVFLLMDPSTRYWGENTQPALLPRELPSEEQLECTIIEFVKSLSVTMQQARDIEGKTRSQRHSPEWFAACRYRITASVFGLIYHRKPDTTPDAVVVKLLDQQQITSPAIKWGIEHESEALKACEEHQHRTGHTELTCAAGFHVSISHPFLGASPDGGVYDPSNIGEPYGLRRSKMSIQTSR